MPARFERHDPTSAARTAYEALSKTGGKQPRRRVIMPAVEVVRIPVSR